MSIEPTDLAGLVATTIRRLVADPGTTTEYREPLVGFADAADPLFGELRRLTSPAHLLPGDLLPGARGVVSFFLPFAPWVVEANARDGRQVAREWAVAYVETNALIGRITAHLAERLAERPVLCRTGTGGIRAAAEPATHNFDETTLVSHWSHKSVAVIAGLGSFGLHQMVITDAGCAGRFGSLVLDAEVLGPTTCPPGEPRERCLYFHDGSCVECVTRCPAHAIDINEGVDKHRCHRYLHTVARAYREVGLADVCGKCAIGPCSFRAAV